MGKIWEKLKTASGKKSFLSRKWLITQEIFVVATILAILGKLSWEWITIVAVSFWGYGIFDAIGDFINGIGINLTRLMKTVSKDDALEIIDKFSQGGKE